MKPKRSDISDFLIDAYGGWYASMVICRHCGHKWGAVYPDTTKPSELECPKCGWFGADIAESEEEE